MLLTPLTSAGTGIDSIDLARKLISAFNTHDVRALGALYADDYEGLDVSREMIQRGSAEVERDLQMLFAALPDSQIVIPHIVGTSIGSLGLFWTISGTQSGSFLRVPPTNRRVSICGFSLLHHEDHRFIRGVRLWDMAGVLRRLRLLPELPDRIQSESQATLFVRLLSLFNQPPRACVHRTKK